ncbi:MAG: hypothetical protein L0312_08890 [Acidobacteria bacterium]|nr:hypothetical protein [Acidobacteriota bacterium]
MKYLVALLASVLSVWMFYFLVAAFFVQFDSLPVILVWLANLVLFVFSLNAAHVISRLFSLMAIETMVVPLSALLHTISSDQDFLLSLQKEGQSPALIQYLLASGWDTEQLILTSVGFTLIFAVFSFFLSPERYALK